MRGSYHKSVYEKSLTRGIVRLGNMELSSAVVTLTLAHPGIQQLEDRFFDSLWGVGSWELLAKLLAGQGNVIPFRLFLLHHNLEHRIFVQFPALAQLANTLRLG